MSAERLVRLGIRVRRELAEAALDRLAPVLAAGAEETAPDADVIEYAVYGEAGALPAEAEIRALAGDALVGIVRAEVPGDWRTRWHRWLEPVEVEAAGRRLRIRPPWTEPSGDAGGLELVIDPGPSFGAGSHATTRLCLEALLAAAPLSGPLSDWGAGSGVLGICAARLGAGPIDAVEVELDALEVILANAAANGVAVRTRWRNLAATAPDWTPLVVANLTADLHALIAAEVLERPPSWLLASGVLAERADALAAAYAPHGLVETSRRERDGWAALVLEAAA